MNEPRQTEVRWNDVLIQVQAGSRDGCDLLFEEFTKRFYWYGIKHGLSHEDAEDIAQETFQNILKKVHTFSSARSAGASSAVSWIWKVYHSTLADWRRRPPSAQPIGNPTEWPDGLVAGFDLEEEIESERFDAALEHCLARARTQLDMDDQRELLRGRGRGKARAGWVRAMERWAAHVLSCMEIAHGAWESLTAVKGGGFR